MYPHQGQWPQQYGANQPYQGYNYGQYPAAYGQFPATPQPYGQPPPPKRQKSTSVVTRYPPPPGYVPPQNSQYPQASYQPPTTPYAGTQYPNYQGYQGFQQPAQTFPATAQSYTPSTYPQTQQQSYTGQTSVSQPVWQAGHAWTQNQQYQPAAYSNATTHSYQAPVQSSNPYTASNQTSQASPPSISVSHVSQPSISASTTASFVEPRPPPVKQDSQHDESQVANEYELDFEEDIEPGNDTDTVQPELSLGIIIWRAPVPAKTPLPSTPAEVDAYVVASAKPKGGEDECMSRYFTKETIPQLELHVRQTDEWQSCKEDLIFVSFGTSPDYVSLQDVVSDRERPEILRPEVAEDLIKTHDEVDVAIEDTPVSHESDATMNQDSDQGDGDQAMDMNSDDEEGEDGTDLLDATESRIQRVQARSPKQTSIFDDLEQALGASDPPHPTNGISSHSLGTNEEAITSVPTSEIVNNDLRARRSSLPRDEKQEDVLAALGVEGPPKRIRSDRGQVNEPLPSSRRASEQSALSRQGSMNTASPVKFNRWSQGPPTQGPYGPKHLPPPPPPPPSGRMPLGEDPWAAHGMYQGNGNGGDSPSSQHTAVGEGSDTDMNDQDPVVEPERPKGEPTSSNRKRPFDETINPSDYEGRRRQENDAPRRKRQPPKVSDAYSRRW